MTANTVLEHEYASVLETLEQKYESTIIKLQNENDDLSKIKVKPFYSSVGTIHLGMPSAAVFMAHLDCAWLALCNIMIVIGWHILKLLGMCGVVIRSSKAVIGTWIRENIIMEKAADKKKQQIASIYKKAMLATSGAENGNRDARGKSEGSRGNQGAWHTPECGYCTFRLCPGSATTQSECIVCNIKLPVPETVSVSAKKRLDKARMLVFSKSLKTTADVNFGLKLTSEEANAFYNPSNRGKPSAWNSSECGYCTFRLCHGSATTQSECIVCNIKLPVPGAVSIAARMWLDNARVLVFSKGLRSMKDVKIDLKMTSAEAIAIYDPS